MSVIYNFIATMMSSVCSFMGTSARKGRTAANHCHSNNLKDLSGSPPEFCRDTCNEVCQPLLYFCMCCPVCRPMFLGPMKVGPCAIKNNTASDTIGSKIPNNEPGKSPLCANRVTSNNLCKIDNCLPHLRQKMACLLPSWQGTGHSRWLLLIDICLIHCKKLGVWMPR